MAFCSFLFYPNKVIYYAQQNILALSNFKSIKFRTSSSKVTAFKQNIITKLTKYMDNFKIQRRRL